MSNKESDEMALQDFHRNPLVIARFCVSRIVAIRKQQNKRQKVDSSVRVDCHALPYGKSRNDKEKNLPSHCEAKPKQSTESTNHIKGASSEAIYIAIHPDKIVEFLNDLLGSFHKDLVHYGEVKVGASAP